MVAAAVSINKWISIKDNDLLYRLLTFVDENLYQNNIRTRTEATAALAVAAGVVIPVGIAVILLRLFKIRLGALGRIIVVLVSILLLLPFHVHVVKRWTPLGPHEVSCTNLSFGGSNICISVMSLKSGRAAWHRYKNSKLPLVWFNIIIMWLINMVSKL